MDISLQGTSGHQQAQNVASGEMDTTVNRAASPLWDWHQGRYFV